MHALAVVFLAISLAGAEPTTKPVPETNPAPLARPPDFAKDILPLFTAKCFRCHGGAFRKGDLDLGSVATILKGGETGPAIVPGKSAESFLLEKVRDGAMPPAKKDRLDAEQVSLIRRWIDAGAPAGDSSTIIAEPAVTQHDVLPILFRRCTVCHGRQHREAGLDLRTRAAILKGGKSGPTIIPGKPEESLLLRKIRAGDMPPLRKLIEVSIKPIEPAETALLGRWIALGAPEDMTKPDIASTRPDPLVTDKDRDFWAFRAPKAGALPAVHHREQVRNPIDAFILQKLEARGLKLSPEADRAGLMRRVCLDLTGLPADPDEVQAFLTDTGADAYERLVDRLLASPRYGERWGRHWLDLAGYADSEGKREQDLVRPFAYRYRDYVIRSLNADKPYDRFLVEQIAGDELADCEHAPVITDEMYDNLVATGFLRMAPDPTWYNLTNFVPDRLDVIADEIDVLGAAVMGLTLKCARCHSHKFDPIPHRDYYRLLDVFKGAFDEHDWMKSNWLPSLSSGPRSDRDLSIVTTAERLDWEAHGAGLTTQIALYRAKLEHEADQRTKKLFEHRLAQLPAVVRDDARVALALAPEKRNAVQVYLAGKFEKTLRVERAALPGLDAGFKKLTDETNARIAGLEARRLPEPKIRALWDRGDPSPTYILRRGDYLTPGRQVGPGAPAVLTDGKTPFEVKPPWPGAKTTGRRLAFARWLTKPDHPLTARVLVNRLWRHHFGAGLVKTLDNFGKAGAWPSHPELLDWLACECVRRGSRLKDMHRLMITSATYRQTSRVSEDLVKRDSENVLLSRMPLQRMSAEQLYDSLLLTSGRLDETRFGPPVAVEVRPDGLATPVGTARGWRRAIYLQQQRKVIVTHLETFDFPQMNPNCIDRRDTTAATQALHLMNNGMVQRLADEFANRVRREVGNDRSRQVERIYLVALGRLPNAEERNIGVAALARFAEVINCLVQSKNIGSDRESILIITTAMRNPLGTAWSLPALLALLQA